MPSPINIRLLCTTDEHGFLERADRIQAFIERTKAANPGSTLVVSCGDVYEGAAVSELEGHKTALQLLDVYDVVTTGNHDFAKGKSFLTRWANQSRYDILSANVEDSSTHGLVQGLKASTIKEAGGFKIGFLGVVTQEAGKLNRAEDVTGLDFHDPIPAAQKSVKELRDNGADIVIALTHLTPEEDQRFVAQVEGVDWNLGGHTHESYKKPQTSGLHPFAKAGYARTGVVQLDLMIDPITRKLVDYDYQLISAKGLPDPPPESPATAMVASANSRVDAALQTPVARSLQELPHTKDDSSPILCFAGEQILQQTGADVVFFDRGQIRHGLPTQEVSVGQLLDIAPFQTKLVSVDLSRERLKEILQRSNQRTDNSRLHVSGVDCSGEPRLADGRDLPETVHVVTTTYLAKGNAGYLTADEAPARREWPVIRDFLETALSLNNPSERPSVAKVLSDAGLSLRTPR